MNRTDTTAKVASTDKFGLAPEISHYGAAHNAGVVEASRIFGAEITRLRAAMGAVEAEERDRCAKLCMVVATQLCDMYGDGAECIATGDACAAAIRGTADTSYPVVTNPTASRA